MFTAAITIAIGWERPVLRKLVGIVISFGGAVFIVCFGQTLSLGSSAFAGNVLFFLNVNAFSAYALITRPLIARHPPLLVTVITFWIDVVLLGLSVAVIEGVPGASINQSVLVLGQY